MEQKLSDTLVKAIDRSNPMMQNLQLASRFNALVDSQGGDLEDNHETIIDVSTYTEPVEVTPTEGKDGMKKNTITLSNMPAVETTKQATIDVSTYDPANKPVITPTAGKQSMAEVEITLNNIPSGGGVTAYAWKVGNRYNYYDFSVAPDEAPNPKAIAVSSTTGVISVAPQGTIANYEKVSDTQFSGWGNTYTRDATQDFTLWS
jgi:hypothetical protein